MSKTPILTYYEAGDMGRRSLELTQAAWLFYSLNPHLVHKEASRAQIIQLAFSNDKAND
jgi:hypothetical protein